MKNGLLILFLILLNALCNGQNKNVLDKTSTTIQAQSLNFEKPVDPTDGIIYFSGDNGMTWKNTSAGLPEKISIGLGAMAVSPDLLGIVTKEKGVYLFDFQRNAWVNIPTDQQVIKNNPGDLIFYKNEIYVGTQHGGVFWSNNRGKTWTSKNSGLGNSTIRKFAEINNKLYAGTNDGLYSYNETLKKWELEYGNRTMQVNGITDLDGSIFIGTNQGVFRSDKALKTWKQVFPDHTLHNISTIGQAIYAMTYNELFYSADKGISWQSIQTGLPKNLYTFNVIENNNAVFAGQWDGVYTKDLSAKEWKFSGNGLPGKFAATNLKSYNGILIISCSERRLR